MVALREELAGANGIQGLEVFTPDAIADVVRVFRRDGFVVVADVLEPDQLELLRSCAAMALAEILALDPQRRGNRGSHRYSFGASSTTRSQLHRPGWQQLVDLATITPIVTAIFGSDDYILRSASGDVCLPGAVDYQPLHSDMRDWTGPDSPFSSFQDHRGMLSVRDLPCPYVCVNFLLDDSTPLNGPTRQIPGSQHSREPIPTLAEEPDWMRFATVCPAPAGSALIRDVRAWHGGTPNVSDEIRAIPNVEFYAPWFREPIVPCISSTDHARLSERAQQILRFHVVDSATELRPEPVIGGTPGLLDQALPSDHR